MPDSPRKGKCWQQQDKEETGMKEKVKLYWKCKCKIIQIAFSNYWIHFYILVKVYQFNFNYNFSFILVTNLIIQMYLSTILCKLYSGEKIKRFCWKISLLFSTFMGKLYDFIIYPLYVIICIHIFINLEFKD